MQKTSDLDQFVLCADNRKINITHLNELIESIKSCNLLEMRPITVNEKMEVMDGQHRLLAAKELGLPIYYTVEKGINSDHMIVLNLNKQWSNNDYLNHFVQRAYPEYIKLQEFVSRQQLKLKVAISLIMGNKHDARRAFRSGEFKFSHDFNHNQLENCRSTQDIIKKNNGHSYYVESAKFWKALITLVSHDDFDMDKWTENLKKMCTRFGPRVSTMDYLKLMTDTYNWRNTCKIHLTEDDLLCDTSST